MAFLTRYDSERSGSNGSNCLSRGFPLVLRAYLALARFDLSLGRANFPKIYETMRKYPRRRTVPLENIIERTCAAVDLACIWYCKEALCLQRSVVTTCLLRKEGVAAELVLGAQQMPFKAHAWVEVDGRVVNDRPYMREIYAVLDRC
jgi:hypothetical protein